MSDINQISDKLARLYNLASLLEKTLQVSYDNPQPDEKDDKFISEIKSRLTKVYALIATEESK